MCIFSTAFGPVSPPLQAVFPLTVLPQLSSLSFQCSFSFHHHAFLAASSPRGVTAVFQHYSLLKITASSTCISALCCGSKTFPPSVISPNFGTHSHFGRFILASIFRAPTLFRLSRLRNLSCLQLTVFASQQSLSIIFFSKSPPPALASPRCAAAPKHFLLQLLLCSH
jgi:hypothetical protein